MVYRPGFFHEGAINESVDYSKTLQWTGIGTVKGRSDSDSWIQVKLDGFEDGYDTIDVRLATLYAGDGGKAGLHLVPEANTEVFLVKPGHWLAPIIYAGNLRAVNSEQVSPSWNMSSAMKWSLDELNVKVKNLETNSENSIKQKAQDMNFETQQSINLSTDGVKVAIDNTQLNVS